jgi:hypothetical protein
LADRSGAGRSIVAVLAVFGLAGCASGATAPPSRGASPLTTAVPSATASPTVGPTSGPTPLATPRFDWSPVGSIPTDRWPDGFAGSAAGYIVLDGGSRIWFSRDGSTWTPATLPFDGHPIAPGKRSTVASARAVAGGAKGFIVVGDYEHEPCHLTFVAGGPPDCAETPIAWVSANGVDWTSSIGAALPLHNLANPDYRAFRQVWSAADGWDASVESDESVDERALELLHTSDGIHWIALAKPPALAGAGSLALRAGVGLESGRRLVWQQWDRITDHPRYTFATTLDGKTWSIANVVDGRLIDVGGALAPDLPGASWLVGIRAETPVILSSSDLLTWHSADVSTPGAPTGGVPASFARWDGGYLSIVELLDAGSNMTHQTWASPDGITWRLVDTILGKDSSPMLLTDGPAGPLSIQSVDDKLEVSAAPR